MRLVDKYGHIHGTVMMVKRNGNTERICFHPTIKTCCSCFSNKSLIEKELEMEELIEFFEQIAKLF